jgi:hypothetical protein
LQKPIEKSTTAVAKWDQILIDTKLKTNIEIANGNKQTNI